MSPLTMNVLTRLNDDDKAFFFQHSQRRKQEKRRKRRCQHADTRVKKIVTWGGGNRFGTRRRFDEPERISFNGFDPNAPQAVKQPPLICCR